MPVDVEAMSPKPAPAGNAVASVVCVNVEPTGMQRKIVFDALHAALATADWSRTGLFGQQAVSRQPARYIVTHLVRPA